MAKLIATDMDGTLLTTKKQLPPNIFNVIDRLHERKIKFAVASGRQYYTLLKDFEPVKDEVTFICENGAIIFDKGENIFCDEMAYEDIEKLMAVIRQIDHAYPILCGEKSAYIESVEPVFKKNADMYYARCEVVEDLLEAAKKDRICKVAIFDTLDAQTNVYVQLKSFNDQFKVSLSGHEWVDIMNATVNKGEAMRLIQKIYGISYDETMAFGDYLNDYEMMQTCYYSYAMANAHPDLKAICHFEAPSNDEYGVIQIIEKFLGK
ncbi:MAG: HAD family hydrolase [Turicibacter sp.]|nr:HAD family hydrolase [Turicibacter sp.]